jgi:heptosyltransferase-1
VEAAFAAIPRLHPGVRDVLPVRLRQWRKRPWSADVRTARQAFDAALRARHYDAVIDTQGLLKSALVARRALGERHGLDWRSAREPLRLFYDRVHRVPWGHHAVHRNRQLAALATARRTPAGDIDYGIVAPEFPPDALLDDSPPVPDNPWLTHADRYTWVPARPWAVLLHATSADAKLWPVFQWKKLAAALAGHGLATVLPWGSAAEKQRADEIAAGVKHAIVPPALGIRTLAGLLGHAVCAVGVDTGLTHLAAALGVPTVGVFVATDPRATGVLAARAVNAGGKGEVPSVNDVLGAVTRVRALPR